MNIGDISLLNANFETISEPIDGYESLFFDLFYYRTGTFELHLPPRYFHTARDAEYIYVSGNNLLGVIDEVAYTDNEGGLDLVVKGSTPESIFRDRVADTVYEYNGTVDDVVYAVLTKYALTGDRKISNLILEPKTGLYTEIIHGAIETGAELESWLYSVLKPLEASYTITYDFAAQTLVFALCRGADRTVGNPNDNTVAIFSETFENLSGISYQKSKSGHKNFAYVKGENLTVTVDQTNGCPRREMYIESSIKSGEVSNYANALRQQGVEALEQNKLIENVGGEILSAATLIYGEDYALGDLCDINAIHGAAGNMGIQWQSRITELMIIYERSGVRYEPKFGEAQTVTNIRRLIKELK